MPSSHCRAKVAYPNADTYEGSFNDARQKHGRGTYTWSTNTGSNPWVPEEGFPEGTAPVVKYEGQYVEGKKQGIGKMTFPNGDKYHGSFGDMRFGSNGRRRGFLRPRELSLQSVLVVVFSLRCRHVGGGQIPR